MPTLLTHLFRRFHAVTLILLLACSPAVQAEGARPHPAVTNPNEGFKLDFGFGKDIALVAVGLGAVIGVGLYLILRKGPSVTGCVEEKATGLALKNEADARGYTLIGKTAALKPGERVHIYGKKEGKTDPRQFVVKKLGKDLGACDASIHQ